MAVIFHRQLKEDCIKTFGVTSVLIHEKVFKISTYRNDRNNLSEDVLTRKLTDDLRSRDFTINAIAYSPKVGIVDPLNGVTDLNNKVICCIEDPVCSFKEDPLRILRALRLSAKLDFKLRYQTFNAVRRYSGLVLKLSGAQVGEELRKMASTKGFSGLLSSYKYVFEAMIPELSSMYEFEQNNPYHDYTVMTHTLKALEHYGDGDLIVNLAILFHDIGKPMCYTEDSLGIGHCHGHGKYSEEIARKVLTNLCFEKEALEKVCELVEIHDRVIEDNPNSVRRLIEQIGNEQFYRLMALRRADILAQNPVYASERLLKVIRLEEMADEIVSDMTKPSKVRLALTENDIQEILNIPEGKAVGVIIRALQRYVVDGEVENTKEALTMTLTKD